MKKSIYVLAVAVGVFALAVRADFWQDTKKAGEGVWQDTKKVAGDAGRFAGDTAKVGAELLAAPGVALYEAVNAHANAVKANANDTVVAVGQAQARAQAQLAAAQQQHQVNVQNAQAAQQRQRPLGANPATWSPEPFVPQSAQQQDMSDAMRAQMMNHQK